MTTIREAVMSSLANNGLASYGSAAGPVIRDLENREREITGRLIDFAADAGIDVEEATRYLNEAGMAVGPTPMSGGEGTSEPSTVETRLATIEHQVQALTVFARRNGFRDV